MPRKSVRQTQKTAAKFFLSLAVCLIAFVITNRVLAEINKPPTCANSKSCTDLSLKIENGATGVFAGKTVIPPTIDLSSEIATPVLGDSTPEGDKHIYIDLKKQKLYAYQGSELIFDTLVSTGKWGRTPVGNFAIWQKLRATRMAGGSGADYYNLPNVPYTMYFYHDFGLHGAYWHNNFGHTMSHGCVNMRQIDAKVLFEWADGPERNKLGTAVSVCDEITQGNTCIQKNPVQ